jgi:hypothetical protein
MVSKEEVLNFTAADMMAVEGEIRRIGVIYTYAGNGLATVTLAEYDFKDARPLCAAMQSTTLVGESKFVDILRAAANGFNLFAERLEKGETTFQQ